GVAGGRRGDGSGGGGAARGGGGGGGGPAMTSRIFSRASRACCNAAASTSAGRPSIFVSSCSAVTYSDVPATLKSMSPNASSAPRMSVSVTYLPSWYTRPIAMPATGALIGTPASINPRVHHRQRRTAHRTHRGGAVRRQHVGDDAQRVRPLGRARDHRHERAFRQSSVTDLAPLRRTDAAGLARGEGREVVVVHVALAL